MVMHEEKDFETNNRHFEIDLPKSEWIKALNSMSESDKVYMEDIQRRIDIGLLSAKIEELSFIAELLEKQSNLLNK